MEMKDIDLKKLNRKELLEVLLAQADELERVKGENEELSKREPMPESAAIAAYEKAAEEQRRQHDEATEGLRRQILEAEEALRKRDSELQSIREELQKSGETQASGAERMSGKLRAFEAEAQALRQALEAKELELRTALESSDAHSREQQEEIGQLKKRLEESEAQRALQSTGEESLSDHARENEELKARLAASAQEEKHLRTEIEGLQERLVQMMGEIATLSVRAPAESVQYDERAQENCRREYEARLEEQRQRHEAELEELRETHRRETATLRRQAENRAIVMRDVGNIAEAALKLNDVFGAAEAAVAQYKESVEKLSREQGAMSRLWLDDTEKKVKAMLEDADDRIDEANKRLKEIETEGERILAEANRRAEELSAEAEKKRLAAELEAQGVLAEAESAAERKRLDAEIDAKQKLSDAEKQAAETVSKAELQAEALVEEAQQKAAASHAEADSYWQEVSARLESFYNDHMGLQRLLEKAEPRSNAAEEE